VAAAVAGYAAAGAAIWAIIVWNAPEAPATEHTLTLPAARSAVDRFNSALKEQIRHDLGPTSEAPARRDEPAVRITPYVSPLGAGIAGTF
jgi:hypothetical protein